MSDQIKLFIENILLKSVANIFLRNILIKDKLIKDLLN